MADIASKITTLSRWIDDSYPADVQGTETHMRRRIDKLMEEVGEVGQALGGMWGENPRKGFTHGVEDVKAELLDVAVTALGAWVHCDDEMDVMAALDAKLDFILDRVGLAAEQCDGDCDSMFCTARRPSADAGGES